MGCGTVMLTKMLSLLLLFGLVILPVNLAVPAFIPGVSLTIPKDDLLDSKNKRQNIQIRLTCIIRVIDIFI
ncbi:hypothetical protein D3C87_1361700 [compost metagenome]